ncbi:MAG: hypothetical protein ACFFDB_02660 [Promethearchaeota archaeon]
MIKNYQIVDRLFNTIPGYIFGILTFTIGLLGDVLALIFSPEYHMWTSSISWLGIQTGGVFLRLGFIFSNIFAILHIIYLGRSVKDENVNDLVRKIAIGCGIITSINFLLTGVFSGTDPLNSYLHGVFALFSFIGGALTCSIYSFLFAKNPKFSKSITYFNIIISGIVVSYLIPFFITNFCNLYQSICFSFGAAVYIIMPIYEWTMIFGILLWYLINSIYIAKKKL